MAFGSNLPADPRVVKPTNPLADRTCVVLLDIEYAGKISPMLRGQLLYQRLNRGRGHLTQSSNTLKSTLPATDLRTPTFRIYSASATWSRLHLLEYICNGGRGMETGLVRDRALHAISSSTKLSGRTCDCCPYWARLRHVLASCGEFSIANAGFQRTNIQ